MTFIEPVYLSYEIVRDYVLATLAQYGYGTDEDSLAPMPTFSEGPAGDSNALKASPEAIVFLTVGGGPGLSHDGAFDRTFIAVRIVGRQGDGPGARRLAAAVDMCLLAFSGSDMLGSLWTLYITRSGGRPALLQKDAAERYHHTCSYIAEPESGL